MNIQVNPYLVFKGNTEEAFNFYRSVFGGEFAMIMRMGEAPAEYAISEEYKDKIMHIAYPIGKGNVLMGNDVVGAQADETTIGNNFVLSVHAESDAGADELYAKLSAGGNAHMPMAQMFWGSYFGMLTDRFGINWMVTHDKGYQQ